MYWQRHKYWASRQEYNWIKFRSKLEVSFYKFFIENNIKILEFEPKYLLQSSFECQWIKFRPIEYKADFLIEYQWDIYVIEAKGMETPEFKLKYKMWMKRYWAENNYILAKSLKSLKEQLWIQN